MIVFLFLFVFCLFVVAGIIAAQQKDKKPHVKKPLNAFMLFMKEKRGDVIKECTLKESAAINQILGKMVRLCLVSLLRLN